MNKSTSNIFKTISKSFRRKPTVGVLSIQTIEGVKAALTPKEIPDFINKHSKVNFDKTGDGHTGLAMAQALNAPFAVARTSKADQKIAGKALKLKSGGLLVLTGHGSAGGANISGNYIGDPPLNHFKNRNSINRKPEDIVNAAMAAGLKKGSRINILLGICYGAADSKENANDSFARKLAIAFAKEGISTEIMASDAPVKRFGGGAIKDGKISFDENTGIAAENLHVFSTVAKIPTNTPTTMVTKSAKAIELSAEGIRLAEPKPVQPAIAEIVTRMLLNKGIQDFNFSFSTFLDRDQATSVLENDNNLKFIIRSASVEGYLGITHRTNTGKIAHALLKIEDVQTLNPENIHIYTRGGNMNARPEKSDSFLDFARKKAGVATTPISSKPQAQAYPSGSNSASVDPNPPRRTNRR